MSRRNGGPIYPDDLTVGMSIDVGTWEATAEDIVDFASRWDPQPFHVDADKARTTPFGGLVASGVHTMAIFQRLAVLGFYRDSSLIAGRGMRDLRLRKPVRPGMVLRGTLEVEDITLRDDGRAIVAMRGKLRDQTDDIVVEMVGEALMARRSPSDEHLGRSAD